MATSLFQTPRLTVRRLDPTDLDPFYDMQRNPNVMRYIKPTMTYEEARIELERFIGYYGDHDIFFQIWAVVEKRSGEFVGICGVYSDGVVEKNETAGKDCPIGVAGTLEMNKGEETKGRDERKGPGGPNDTEEYQIAYRLREKHWGKGFGKEIAVGLIEYCFEGLGLGEVVAYVQVGNEGSIRILEGLMTFEEELYAERAQGMERKYRKGKDDD